MKFRGMMMLPLAAAALALPGAARAQEDDDCPCRERRGMIGVSFETEDSDEGVRIVEVRRGSPADRAGVHEGDVVVLWNGKDADEAFQAPLRLQSGDTVRLRVRRGGDEREFAVVAEPRTVTAYSFSPQLRRRAEVVITGLDSLQVPLDVLTMRIDSLHTQLMHLDTGAVRFQMDSLMTLFHSDSGRLLLERMPGVEFRIADADIVALGLREGLADMEDHAALMEERAARTEGEAAEQDGYAARVEAETLITERPFFMELGRRSAAGAELAELNEGLSRYFGGQREGALVIEVAPETPAARAGLEPGDIIVRAGGEQVEGPEDVRHALTRAEDGRVEMEVIRRGDRRTLSLEWTGERVIHREVRPLRPARPRRN